MLPAPRRFRRHLLLPPGWVALGFLLLFGCLSLRAHWRQLRLPNVLQITMFPLKQDTAGLAYYRRYSSSPDNTPYTTPYQSAADLNKLRPWQDIEFGGQPLHDFYSAFTLESAIRKIQADSSHAGGVRLFFRRGTTYGDMVKVLDIMLITDQKKYWLDNRHKPLTLYAITDKQLPASPDSLKPFICGTRYQAFPVPQPPFTFQAR